MFLFSFIAFFAFVSCEVTINRVINLKGNVATEVLDVKLSNEKLTNFQHVLPLNLVDKVSYMYADFLKVERPLKYVKSDENWAYYTTKLPKKAQGGEYSFKIHVGFTHLLRPFPAKIGQNDPVLVKFETSANAPSVYTLASSTTKIETNAKNILSYTDLSPVKTAAKTVKYGPFRTVKPLTFQPVYVHFETTSPFITATEMVKEIEISHWGNVAVEEHYSLKNSAGTYKGAFSRLQYARGAMNYEKDAAKSFWELEAHLPRSARDAYLKDKIGNVTSSNFRPAVTKRQKYSLLEFSPRYPLMPGWKTDFYFGYNMPSHEALARNNKDGRMTLKVKLGCPIQEAVVDNLVVRVILPEGVSDIELNTPFEVERSPEYVRKTYLDTTGRPVVEFRVKNAVAYHNQFFEVTYAFPAFYLLREPAYLVTVIFAFFVLFIAYSRIDLSLSPKTKTL